MALNALGELGRLAVVAAGRPGVGLARPRAAGPRRPRRGAAGSAGPRRSAEASAMPEDAEHAADQQRDVEQRQEPAVADPRPAGPPRACATIWPSTSIGEV